MKYFSFEHLDTLSTFDEKKEYLKTVIYPRDNGIHSILFENKTSYVKDDVFQQVYLNRFDNDIVHWYTRENINILPMYDIEELKNLLGDKYNYFLSWNRDEQIECLLNINKSFDVTTNFNFEYYDSLDFQEQEKYLSKVMYPLDDGNHCVIMKNKPHIYTDKTFKNIFINRFSGKLATWYLKENKQIHRLCEFIECDNKYCQVCRPCKKIEPEINMEPKMNNNNSIWKSIFG